MSLVMRKSKKINCAKNEQSSDVAVVTNKDKVKLIITDLGCDIYSIPTLCHKYNLKVHQFYSEIYKDKELEKSLSLARINQAWIYADQIIDIADSCPKDKDEVNKARLAIDARKFLLARLTPQKHLENLVTALEAANNNENSRLEKVINDAKGDASALSKIYEQLIKQPAVLQGSASV